MESIAVIGVGALGKRHLQSLTELDRDVKLYGVESNPETIRLLEEEFNQQNKVSVTFVQEIESLPTELDFVVIATSSNVRRMLFEKLTDHATVRNILFEKVLFQKVEDYSFVAKRLKERNIKAWVNCARREFDSYHELKAIVGMCKYFTFSAIGGQWGMGCNGIHMLDLIEFLAGEQETNIDISKVFPKIADSKRKGFYEFFGTITGDCGCCNVFQLTCLEDTAMPFMIEVAGDKVRAIINEGKQEIYIAKENNGWVWEKKAFPIKYQSQLTKLVAEAVLENGDCRLATYDDSEKLHLKFIEPLIGFFEEQGMEEGLCPIT